jgi:hypothetical protein
VSALTVAVRVRGRSVSHTGIPTPLHSDLARALDAWEGPAAAFKGIPGGHAEFNALNKGLNARPGSQISDFMMYSIRLRGAQKGSQIRMCENCAGILKQAEDI